MTTLPRHDIHIPVRYRKTYDGIPELAESISRFGLICPLTVRLLEDGTHELVAGGRRYEALTLLASDESPHPHAINVPVYIRHDVPLADARLMELVENLHREDVSWQETICGIYDVHRMMEKSHAIDGQRWTQQMTGQLMRFSAAYVSYAKHLAQAIMSGDEEVISADGPAEAIAVLAKRERARLEKHRATILDNAVAIRKTPAQNVLATTDAEGNVTPIIIDEPDMPALTDTAVDAWAAAQRIVQHGDSINVLIPAIPDATFDGIFTDIPYGIDMGNLDIKHIGETASAHDRDANIADFETFLREAYRVLKPSTFCVFWMDVEHTTLLQQLARAAGFRVQRWPLHAQKPIAKNEAASYNTTKDYESVLVCAKEGATLVNKSSTSFIPWQFDKGEREQYAHPFVKPHNANAWLLNKFFYPSAHLLDPYCGEGSGVLSMLRCGHTVTAMELEEHHVIRAREHVAKLLTTNK